MPEIFIILKKEKGENAVTVNDVKSVEENIEVNAENFPDEAFREYVSGDLIKTVMEFCHRKKLKKLYRSKSKIGMTFRI